MMQKWLRSTLATLVMSSMVFGAVMQPAKADTTSTVLITAAAVAALMTGINVAEKNARANQLVGYLPNGAPVFADGGVIGQNGQKWYPGNNGQNISCNAGRCVILGTGYNGYNYSAYGYPNGYGGYPGAYAGYGAPSNYGGYGYPNGAYGGYAPATTVNQYVTRTVRTIYVRHDNGLHRGWDKKHDRDDNDRGDDDHDH